MANDDIKGFEEFWPHYVRAHASKGNRRLHFAGTSVALALAAYGVVARKLWPFLVAPVVGYGCAWIGHFFIEGNVPATFGHPLWSLEADFLMWKKTIEGTMDSEVEKHMQAAAAAAAPKPHVADPVVN